MAEKEERNNHCAFDRLFSRNAPHILEMIFFSLDFCSFRRCREVSRAWNRLLVSEPFQRKAKGPSKNVVTH